LGKTYFSTEGSGREKEAFFGRNFGEQILAGGGATNLLGALFHHFFWEPNFSPGAILKKRGVGAFREEGAPTFWEKEGYKKNRGGREKRGFRDISCEKKLAEEGFTKRVCP